MTRGVPLLRAPTLGAAFRFVARIVTLLVLSGAMSNCAMGALAASPPVERIQGEFAEVRASLARRGAA